MTYHKPKTPELSIEAIVKWLREHPSLHPASYAYQDPSRCLLGQYMHQLGAHEAISEAAYESFIPNAETYRAIAAPKPHTFGAALTRATKLLELPAPSPAFDPPRLEQGEPEPAAEPGH